MKKNEWLELLSDLFVLGAMLSALETVFEASFGEGTRALALSLAILSTGILLRR